MAPKRDPATQTKSRLPAGRGRRSGDAWGGQRGRGGKTGRAFAALVALEARLRGPKGCPWDRKQTHRTLRTFLLEETYEVLEAIDSGDSRKLAEELGDLLLQVVFHAQIAREQRRFTINDIIQAICSKLVRRHPHVFGKVRARHVGEVLRNWELIKAQERQREARRGGQDAPAASDKRAGGGPEGSLLDGLPKGLPATLEAYQITRRAARIGFDWDSLPDLLEKLPEEAQELWRAVKQGREAKTEEEVGDLLFAAVNAARFLKIDPETALRRANQKFRMRFQEMERRAREQGKKLATVERSEMEELWNATKLEGHKLK
jgi:MazG family protein